MNYELTLDLVRDLTSRAQRGDGSALRQLRQINRQLARRANTRLRRLEQENLDYYAYDRAQAFINEKTNNNRFTTSSRILEEPSDYRTQILELVTFLESESSTVRGQRAIQNRRVESFRENGVNIPAGAEQMFNDFLSTGLFDELKDYVDSDQVAYDFGRIVENKDISFQRIDEEFTKVLEGQITYDIALENLGVPIL